MRVELQPAYVLHTRSYRDTSLLVELLTRDHGRVSVVAKGAKPSARKKRVINLQVFSPILVSWMGRSNLKTLTQREMTAATPTLIGERLYSGLYVNELLVRVLQHEDPHPRLFDLYHQVLLTLASQQPVDITLRHFELSLLEELGYGINCATEAEQGNPVCEEQNYYYLNEVGLVSSATREYKHLPIYRGKDLKRIAEGNYTKEVRACAKLLMRQALAPLIGDKPLNSRLLFARQKRLS